MKDTKISVIVPVYNVPENMLRKCLNSLISQTYKNIEIIVVDDGSTDKSGVICDEYKSVCDFMKVFHKKNGGLCDARNYGVNEASGEWISFVDGDDYLEKETFLEVISRIEKNVDIVCFGTIKEYKSKKFKYDYNEVFKNEKLIIDRKKILKILLDFRANIGDVTAKLYKRNFLINNNIFHNKEIKQGVEAIDFNFRCFEKMNKFQFIDFYGYNYAFNNSSITMTMNEKNMLLLLKGINSLYKNLENSQYVVDLKENLDCRINYVAVTTAISGVFSLSNKEKFKEKKRLMNLFTENSNVKEALYNHNIKIDIKRKIILELIKKKKYFLLYMASIIRKIEKNK